jgi:hypothetical protein
MGEGRTPDNIKLSKAVSQTVEEVLKFNPNHGQDGKFSSGGAPQVEKIRAAIENAQGGWVGADWTHEQVARCDHPDHGRLVPCPHCFVVREPDSEDGEQGSPVYCEGDDVSGCQTCRDAEADAEEAERLGQAALEELAVGDVAACARNLRAAANLEAAYGDDPTWGPPALLAEQSVDK